MPRTTDQDSWNPLLAPFNLTAAEVMRFWEKEKANLKPAIRARFDDVIHKPDPTEQDIEWLAGIVPKTGAANSFLQLRFLTALAKVWPELHTSLRADVASRKLSFLEWWRRFNCKGTWIEGAARYWVGMPAWVAPPPTVDVLSGKFVKGSGGLLPEPSTRTVSKEVSIFGRYIIIDLHVPAGMQKENWRKYKKFLQDKFNRRFDEIQRLINTHTEPQLQAAARYFKGESLSKLSKVYGIDESQMQRWISKLYADLGLKMRPQGRPTRKT